MEQLRATLQSDLQEKNEILDKLTGERGEFPNLVSLKLHVCRYLVARSHCLNYALHQWSIKFQN